MTVDYYNGLIRPILEGRKVILATGHLTGQKSWLRLLAENGAKNPLLLAQGIGTGTMPDPDELDHVVVGSDSDSMMQAIRSYDRGLRDLSPNARAAIEAYDPEGEALVIGVFLSDFPDLLGRPRYSLRPASWAALEDKINIEAFWNRHGIPHAPALVVPPTEAALTHAATTLDQGLGTCWAGDNKAGFNGGASYLRWIAGPEHVPEAVRFFAKDCERVRVMPFIEGIPCSVHGIVFPDHVAALRPCEMVVMRRPGQSRLLYAGAASYWDPPTERREQLRALCRRVGDALREEVGYRGPFTLDGIMGADGFVPTELNARFGAAMGLLTAGAPSLNFYMLCELIKAGEPLDWRPQELEALLLESADGARRGGGWCVVPRVHPTETVTRRLRRDGQGGWRLCADDTEEHHARLLFGPSEVGGFLRFSPVPEHMTVGRSVVPDVVEVFALADQVFGTGFGPLVAAQDLFS